MADEMERWSSEQRFMETQFTSHSSCTSKRKVNNNLKSKGLSLSSSTPNVLISSIEITRANSCNLIECSIPTSINSIINKENANLTHSLPSISIPLLHSPTKLSKKEIEKRRKSSISHIDTDKKSNQETNNNSNNNKTNIKKEQQKKRKDFANFWYSSITNNDVILHSTESLYNSIFSPLPSHLYFREFLESLQNSPFFTGQLKNLYLNLFNSSFNPNLPSFPSSNEMTKNRAKISDFQIGKQIGKGKFGRIYIARSKSHLPLIFAVKVIPLRKLSSQTKIIQILREVQNLHLTRHHRHVITLFDFLWEEKNIFIVMEYAPGLDLFTDLERNGPMDEEKAIKVIRQVALAVQYCHSLNIIHRDIKPENFVWGGDGFLKLIDFGWSAPIDNQIYYNNHHYDINNNNNNNNNNSCDNLNINFNNNNHLNKNDFNFYHIYHSIEINNNINDNNNNNNK